MDLNRMSQGERIAVVFDFPDGVDRGIGLILSLVAAAAIAYGGYTAAGGSGRR